MTNKKTMNKKDGKYIPAELQQIDRLRSELRERCKELECIYSISRIVDKYSETDNIIRDIVNIIPDSWQFPEKTCCRVIIKDKIYTSANFKETRFRLFRSISILKEKIGIIEVFYIDPTEKLKRAPFLKAERSLLIVIAERLGKIIERKRSELALKKSYKSLQELYEHMQTIREDERRKIAMEIHDELGQALTSLKIDLRWLRNKQDTPDNKKSLSKIVSMENLVDGTIKKIQQIATELRPPLLDDFGFPEAVSWYLDQIKQTGINCTFTHDESPGNLTRESSLLIYQILRELATNVIRHAEADSIHISMREITGYLEIIFKDNGKGITREQSESLKSFGLYNLKERINYWGGSVDIAGNPGSGTEIRIIIPKKRVF